MDSAGFWESGRLVKWTIAAPFFRAGLENHWLDDFAPPGRHQFHKVPFEAGAQTQNWHQRATRGTPIAGWLPYWHTAGTALAGTEGVITLFPQLAATTSVRRMLSGRRAVPIVAWCFNVGRLPGGVRQAAARIALGTVERFVVHSTAEVALIADYLGISRNRVRFVPLQRAPIEVTAAEDTDMPFAVAMGSANRDYATLVEAARLTGLPVTIVASPRCMEGLDIPENVTALSDLTPAQCHILAQRARLSIVPLADVGVASGQVTVIEAQRMGRPVITTRSVGTTDYVEDGASGLLVRQSDPHGLAAAMSSLWDDKARRRRIAEGGAAFAEACLSDEAAGRALADLLDEVADETEGRRK